MVPTSPGMTWVSSTPGRPAQRLMAHTEEVDAKKSRCWVVKLQLTMVWVILNVGLARESPSKRP